MSGLERQSKYWPVTLSGEDYWSISRPWTDADWNQRRLLIWEFSKCSRINIHCCEMCLGATHLFHKYNTLVLLCIQSKIWDEKAQMIVIYSLSVLFLFPFSLINFVTKFAICIESCFFLSPVWFKNWGFTCIPWLLQHCKAGRQGQKLCQLHLLSFDALLNLYVCHWQRNGQSLISWQFDFNGERQNIKKFRKNEHYIKGIHWFACNLNKYLIPKHNIT